MFTALPGLILGAETTFREKGLPFLHTLPLPRSRVALATLAPAWLAPALIVAGMALLRPSLLEEFRPHFLLASLTLFLGGACLTLQFRNALFGATAAIGGLLGLLQILGGISLYSTASSARGSLGLVNALAFLNFPFRLDGLQVDKPFLTTGFLLLLATFAPLALRFLRQEEPFLLRNRVKNWLCLSASLLAVLAISLALQVSGCFFQNDRWILHGDPPFMAGKRSIAILERMERHPQLCRLSILDRDSGRLTGQFEGMGFREMNWLEKEETLALFTEGNSLLERLRLLAPSTLMLTVTLEGQLVNRTTLPSKIDASTFRPSPDGRILFSKEEERGKQYSLFALDPRTGVLEKLLNSRRRIELLTFLEDQWIVDIADPERHEAYRIEAGGLRKLEEAQVKSDGGFFLIQDVLYRSVDAARARLAELYPLPRIAPKAEFLIDSLTGCLLNKTSMIFALTLDPDTNLGSLLAWDYAHLQWLSLSNQVQFFPRSSISREGYFQWRFREEREVIVSFSRKTGLALFLEDKGGQTILSLADARLGRSFELMVLTPDVAPQDLQIGMSEGAGQVRVSWCVDLPNGEKSKLTTRFYTPGSGKIEMEARASGKDEVKVKDKAIFRVEASGMERRLWPIAQTQGTTP